MRETPQGEILYTPHMLSPCSAEQHGANSCEKAHSHFLRPTHSEGTDKNFLAAYNSLTILLRHEQ